MRRALAPALLLLLAVASAASSSSPSTACDPHYERRNASTGLCDCREGFSGFGCRMCTASGASVDTADVCSASFGADYSCVSGLRYDAHATLKTYGCTLSSDLQALFPDGALDVRCDRDVQGVANCSAAVFKAKDTVRSVHVIDCNITDCAFATGDANGECAQIDCKCGPQCSAMTKALVESTLSGKPAKIEVTNTTQLAIVIKDSPIPLSATCTASACERTGGGGSSASGSGSSGGDAGGLSGLWVAIVACAALAATLLLCGCACSCCLTASIRRGQTEDVETEILKFTSRSANTLEFRHVSCYSDQDRQSSTSSSEPKRILHKISGSVSRGQVLGLLGPSGSGKTTLLNALAAVENGRSQFAGEILLDGKRLSKGYRRIAAYVQQDDSLYSTLTVRECILYSAQLRLPATLSDRVKNAMVDRVIAELNLTHVANSRIGSVGGSTSRRGVSGGERRRVSIGMELVTSPQILILDEPTSGLDSSSAHSVVQLVKELAGHGRIVVLSIHQPSDRSFVLLDKIMLLGKGKLLYSGAPAESKSYFQILGFKCPEHENIADFILDIASDTNNIPMIRSHMKQEPSPRSSKPAPSRVRLQNITPRFTIGSPTSGTESSPFMKEDLSLDTPRMENLLVSPVGEGTPKEPSTLGIPMPGTPRSPPPLSTAETEMGDIGDFGKAPSRSIMVEIRVLFARTAQNILRHRSLLVLHIALSVSLALFGGLIFNHVTNDLAGFQNRMGAFYFILTFFGFASMSSMDLFIGERPIFLRETGAMYYGAFSYFLAKATLDTLLLRVLPASLFASIFYWIMGLQATTGRFLLFSVTLVLFNVAAGAICLLVGVLSRRVGSANLGATVVLLIMLLFGGFLLNSQTMPTSVGWLKHLSIFSYAFEILMTNELKGLILKFDAPGYPAVPVYGEVYLKTLGMDYANRYYDVAALGLIAVSLQVLAYLFLSLQVPLHRDMADYEEEDETPAPPRKAEV